MSDADIAATANIWFLQVRVQAVQEICMSHPKHGHPDHPVHPLIVRRWSPYAFGDAPVAKDDLLALFEAARWAASSYNEQPWVFLVATKDDPKEFQRILSCLEEANQAWARHAPVLVLACVRQKFSRNGKPNGVALHDLGLACGNLCVEATARGIQAHMMAGIRPDKARVEFAIPEGVQPCTALAIGYAAEASSLSAEMAQRETSPRSRKPLSEFVHSKAFGKSWA